MTGAMHEGAHGAATETVRGGSGYRHREPLVLTAFFDSPDAVDAALDVLYTAGVPRDLLDVVVSRAAAERFYANRDGAAGRARAPGRETARFAGIGALAGFIGGVLFSLLMLMWPGIDAPGAMAPIALFGPNVGTTLGAIGGALLGMTRRQRPDPRHARAAESEDAILMVVRTRGHQEAALLQRLLEEQGARGARVEAR